MADFPRQLYVGKLPLDGSLDYAIDLSHNLTHYGEEVIPSLVDLSKLPPMQQAQQAHEIQLALENLHHKLSADAHATRRSELRAKQRLVESLSQPPPPAGHLYAQRPRVTAAGSSPERILRPIVLTEVMRGLRRSSSPETRPVTAWSGSPNRTISPRALHFTGTMPTPAHVGTATAAGPSAAAVQRPNHHADYASSPKDPLSPTVQSQGSRPVSPKAKVAATRTSADTDRSTPSSYGGSASAFGKTGDLSPPQPHGPLSRPQLQNQQQQHQQRLQQQLQAQPQSRTHQRVDHLSQQNSEHQQENQRRAGMELMRLFRPQSAGRRYMSPVAAVAPTRGSVGGAGGDASWTPAGRGSSGGSRLQSGGPKVVTPGAASSGSSRGASGTNFSSLDHILRSVGTSAGGHSISTSAAAVEQPQLPSRRGSSAGGAAGVTSGGRYTAPRLGGNQASNGSGGVKGHRGHSCSSSTSQAARQQSAGSLRSRRGSFSSAMPVMASQATLGAAVVPVASGGSVAAPFERPWSAPRSVGMPVAQSTQLTSPVSTIVVGTVGTPPKATRWASGPGSHPLGSRHQGLLDAGWQNSLYSNGGFGRAPPPSPLLPMNVPMNRGRPSSVAVSVPSNHQRRSASLQQRQHHHQEQPSLQTILPAAQSVITESLLSHAAAAQRLQAQLLEDTIADGASWTSTCLVSPLAPRPDMMLGSDGEGGPSLYEIASLGMAEPTGLSGWRQSTSGQTGSAVRMVDTLLRGSLAAINSVAEAASNEVRTWAGLSAVPSRGPSAISPPMVLFSPSRPSPGGLPAAAPYLLGSPVQPSRATSAPHGRLLHPFIVPSGPLWPSVAGANGDSGSTQGLMRSSLQSQHSSRSQPTSPQRSSQRNQQPFSDRRNDGGSADGSPLRPQGLMPATGSSHRGSPAGVADGGSPERTAQGLQALLSFLQQKFELRRERRRAARALEAWRRAAVVRGGGGSGESVGGGSGIRSPRPLEAAAAGPISTSSTRQGRYDSPGTRGSISPINSVAGPSARLRSSLDLPGGVSGGNSGTPSAGVNEKVSPRPYSSGAWSGRGAATSGGGGAFSPGAAPSVGVQNDSLQLPKSFSVSAGDAAATASSPGAQVLQDLTRLTKHRHDFHEPGNLWEGEGERERQQQQRIQQLERELEQVRQQQEQVLRHQQQEPHQHQLQQLLQQLQQLQEQLMQHHRQQQEQLEQLQQRQKQQQQQQQQQPLRPLSSGALLRRNSTGDSRAVGAPQQPSRKAASTSAVQTWPGMAVPPRPAPALRHHDSSIMLPPPPIPVSSSASSPAGQHVTTAAAPAQAPAVPASSTAQAGLPVSLAVASPASSKAAFLDLHQMVSEMERLLTAMNDDVDGAAAAAAGTNGKGDGSGSSIGRGVLGAKTGQPLLGIARSRGAPSPPHLQLELRTSLPPSPRLRDLERPNIGGSASTAGTMPLGQQSTGTRHLGDMAIPGSRTGSARGSLAISFASAAVAPGTAAGGSNSSSNVGSGGGAAGNSRNVGLTARGIVPGSTQPGGAATKTGARVFSTGGSTIPGVLRSGGITGGGGSGGGPTLSGKQAPVAKKELDQIRSNQKSEHLRPQLQGSGDKEAGVTTSHPGTPRAATSTAAVAAALLVSAGRAHANAASATDAMSEQLSEMRASIRRIEQEMWGASAATKSLTRGVATAAAAVHKPTGSPVVRHHPQLVRQQAQPARPYETSPLTRRGHVSLGGSHVVHFGPSDGRSVASSGGVDIHAGGFWTTAPSSRVATRSVATGEAVGGVATVTRVEPIVESGLSSPSGTLRTTFSLRDVYPPRSGDYTSNYVAVPAGVSNTERDFFVTSVPVHNSGNSGSGGGAGDGRRGKNDPQEKHSNSTGGGSINAGVGTERRVSVAASAATATANMSGIGLRQVPASPAEASFKPDSGSGARPGSPSSPGVTRHVDALEAQLLEELGELEDALQKLKHNTGKSVGGI